MQEKLLDSHLRIMNDLTEKPPADLLPRVDGDSCLSTVRVPEEDMTPSLAHGLEPKGLQCLEDPPGGEGSKLHGRSTSMRWRPTNSSSGRDLPSASRYNRTASRIRPDSSSKERA